jgi:hypothetical protein
LGLITTSHTMAADRVYTRRKLIYQRKSAQAAQLTVLTWRESLGLWGSQNFHTGNSRKVSAALNEWVSHLVRTGQPFTLVRQDFRRQTLPQWQEVVSAQNRKPWHA